MAVPPGRASLGSGWPELLTDPLGPGPPPSGTHPLEKAGEPEAVPVSCASGMWISDKSSSSFPVGRPGSLPAGERRRPGLWSLAVACGSAGGVLSRSRSERCPLSPLPFGPAASAGLGSGVAAHGQATASLCLSPFRAEGLQPFGGCRAERPWSPAGEAGGLATGSPGNSWRLAASSSVTKTGMMWTFGGRTAPPP